MSQSPAETAPTRKQLTLKGDLVLRHIVGLKEEVQTALAACDRLLLDLSEATAVDLAFFQLLCAARQSTLSGNKYLGLTGKLPEGFQRKLEEAGFARQVGCGFEYHKSCSWMGRREE